MDKTINQKDRRYQKSEVAMSIAMTKMLKKSRY